MSADVFCNFEGNVFIDVCPQGWGARYPLSQVSGPFGEWLDMSRGRYTGQRAWVYERAWYTEGAQEYQRR